MRLNPYKLAALYELCAVPSPRAKPVTLAPPRRQALPLARRAFPPFSHYDSDRSHTDENPTITISSSDRNTTTNYQKIYISHFLIHSIEINTA
jgi:hypothetical protein